MQCVPASDKVDKKLGHMCLFRSKTDENEQSTVSGKIWNGRKKLNVGKLFGEE